MKLHDFVNIECRPKMYVYKFSNHPGLFCLLLIRALILAQNLTIHLEINFQCPPNWFPVSSILLCLSRERGKTRGLKLSIILW